MNSANPAERLAAALLIRGELTKRLDEMDVLHDENVRRGLADNPSGTLKSLGVNVTPDIERRLAEAKGQKEPFSSAFVSSVVQVATSPAVSVVVSVATSAAAESDKKK